MYGLISQGARELLQLQSRPKRSKRIRLSRRFRQRIFWRDKGLCVYCENPVKFADATMDHIIPLVHRGKSRSKENIGTACASCNKQKAQLMLATPGDLSPEMLWLKFDKTVKETETRRGHYCEWVAAHY